MRLTLLFCLVLGSISTAWSQESEKTDESELARSYYSAIEEKDHDSAEKALKELEKQFPHDVLTRLVTAHWRQLSERDESRSWRELKDSRRRRTPEENPATEELPLIAKVYAVADLVVPIGGVRGKEKSKISYHVSALVELLEDTCLQNREQEHIVFDERTLSLVVRSTEKSHARSEKLLRQLRQQHDLQIIYEITLASIEAEIANTFSLRETITAVVLKERLKRISESNNSSLVMAPKITLFDDQVASIHADAGKVNTKMELHGKIGSSRRSIRTEVQLEISDQLDNEQFKFATSEMIPDGQTAAFFVKTEDSISSFLDRRLLIEKGFEVAPSDSNQLFLFLTPKILILEEEEELIGADKPLPEYAPVTAYPQAHPPYNRELPLAWTPVKLNWDDGYWWDLDFSGKDSLSLDHPWNLYLPATQSKEVIRYWKNSKQTVPDLPETLPESVLSN